jgi:predicted dehydrogenase
VAALRFAIVGCGDVSRRYARAILAASELELAGVADALADRAAALAAELGVASYPAPAAVLADEEVDAVVNLTAPQAHAAVTAACLEARKHVHSEKPVALRHEEARELIDLAERRGVRLSCAPTTLLGEAQQTWWKLVREGVLGTIRVAYAEMNWGRIETWHPAPEALYAVGPLVDVGVYPLTMLTGIFGPARRVQAYGAVLVPDRVRKDGVPFPLETPDHVVAVVELPGVVARVTASFVAGPGTQRGIELHGDRGRLFLAAIEADSRLELSVDGANAEPVALVREPSPGIDWGRALVDLALAVEEGRPHRAAAEHAAHVVEILNAAEQSIREHAPVDVHSRFDPPRPMDWAL